MKTSRLLLAACVLSMLAACGSRSTSGTGEGVARADVPVSDLSRTFDVGLPELVGEVRAEAFTDMARPVEVTGQDTIDAPDVCLLECADKECSDDGCGGSCGECDDGDVCNGVEACQGGLCSAGTALDCSDDNPCTEDACDAVAGCQHVEHDGPCDDGNPCTQGETCITGICTGGKKTACKDGNPCTTDACSSVEGCVHVPNTSPCDDGDSCTGGDQCAQGACQPGENVCFPCQSDLDCLAWDDGNLCNGLVVCSDGLCLALDDSVVVCDAPLNECAKVECVPESGECAEIPFSGMVFCDDGNLCTLDDTCQSGLCTGKPVNCQDGNKCTIDSCLADVGCVHDAVDCPVEPCSTAECIPSTGECLYMPIGCDDGDACTVDGCEPDTGSCWHAKKDCGDDNPCTTDSCISSAEASLTGCVWEPDNSAPCDDGDPTTLNECLDGICLCVPQCPGKECGDDACGGVCGECPETAKCIAGVCKPLPLLLSVRDYVHGAGSATLKAFDTNETGHALVGRYEGEDVVFDSSCPESTSGMHSIVARLASDGSCLWVRYLDWGSPSGYSGMPLAVAVMPDGSILAGGRLDTPCLSVGGGTVCADPSPSPLSNGAFLVSLDNTGSFKWGYIWRGKEAFPMNSVSCILSMEDGTAIVGLNYASKNLVLGDHTLASHDDECPSGYSGLDVAFARVGNDGSFLWADSYGTCGSEELRALAVAGPNGFLAGLNASVDIDMGGGLHSISPLGPQPLFAAFDGDGGYVDSNVLYACGNLPKIFGVPLSVAEQPDGVVLGGWPFFVARFTYGNGSPDWCWNAPVLSAGLPAVRSVVADSYGNTYVAGELGGAGIDPGTGPLPHKGDLDILLARLDGSGQAVWAHAFGSFAEDYPVWVGLLDGGNLAVFGVLGWPTYLGTDAQFDVKGKFFLAEYEL